MHHSLKDSSSRVLFSQERGPRTRSVNSVQPKPPVTCWSQNKDLDKGPSSQAAKTEPSRHARSVTCTLDLCWGAPLAKSYYAPSLGLPTYVQLTLTKESGEQWLNTTTFLGQGNIKFVSHSTKPSRTQLAHHEQRFAKATAPCDGRAVTSCTVRFRPQAAYGPGIVRSAAHAA